MPFPGRIFPPRIFPPRVFPPGARKPQPKGGYMAPEGDDADEAQTGPQLIRQLSIIPTPVVPEAAEANYERTLGPTTPFDGRQETIWWRLDNARLALGDVTVKATARTYLHGYYQYITVTFYALATENDETLQFWGTVTGGQNCPEIAQERTQTIAASIWNRMLGEHKRHVDVRADWNSPYDDACDESFLQLEVEYLGGADTTQDPAYIGLRSYDQVLQHDGTGMQYTWGTWKVDPVAGGLVCEVRSADFVSHPSLAGSPDDAREGDMVSGYGGRPGNRCLEARGVYMIRGTVLATSASGQCEAVAVP